VNGLAPTTERRVAELMTWALEIAEPGTTCQRARSVCAARAVHHLPVVEGGILVGIVCTCDLRKAAPDAPLGKHMRSPVVTIRPDAPTWDAHGTMKSSDVGALPVLYHGFLIGIVTAGDLERAGLTSTRKHCALCGARHHVRATARGHRCVACWDMERGGKE
jgi:CBS domain-containing protein